MIRSHQNKLFGSWSKELINLRHCTLPDIVSPLLLSSISSTAHTLRVTVLLGGCVFLAQLCMHVLCLPFVVSDLVIENFPNKALLSNRVMVLWRYWRHKLRTLHQTLGPKQKLVTDLSWLVEPAVLRSFQPHFACGFLLMEVSRFF